MFNLGLFELTLFGVIALIVLGPEKLPEAARTLGKWYAFALHAKNRLKNDVMTELNLLETQRQIQEELAKLRQAENEMQARMDKLQTAIRQNRPELLTAKYSPASEPLPDNTKDDVLGGSELGNTDNNAWTQIGAFATPSADNSLNAQNTETPNTKPMTGYFFLLGEYDRKKRLPKAPFLPNLTADKLLYEHTQTL